MGKKLIILIQGLVISLSLLAGGEDGGYAVSKIPPGLLKGANAIKRVESIEYEVSSFTKVRYRTKYAITILNEKGIKFASLTQYYDKDIKIESIDGKLFNSNGKEIRSVKNKDIRDYSAVRDISLMEDSRIKVHDFQYQEYPFTLEYDIVQEFKNTYFFPSWFPQPEDGYAVEQASIKVSCPSWYKFKYRAFNYAGGEPVISNEKNENSYVWSVQNLPAIKEEYLTPRWQYITTCIYFTPLEFEIGDYKGSMASWHELGKFQLKLNEGRDKLPESIKQQVHKLVDHIADPKEKVRILYEYMQKNTRYISIQLGIGGLQPFDATYVATNSYGDCKALSNYMYALLKEANIKSCYTQIRSGRGEKFFISDFTFDPFNHIILLVPFQKDTVWLECTSQTIAAGYLGSHTDDRYGLAIDENGGFLVRTPKYGLKENTQIRNIKATLTSEATLEINAETAYGCLQQDRYHGLINNLSKDKVKEALQEELDFATYDIRNFDYKETKQSLPVITESLDILVSNYATITGKRLFIMPNVMTRHQRKLSADSTRKYDLELGFEYRDTDTVQISLPEGYSAESLPKDAAIESKFGKYNAAVKLEGNKLFYYRTIEHTGGRFPATDYPELVKFYETIYKADRSKVVLVKKEETKGF
jgi:Domain of Unknown Function with PDB structure (DUF3857)